jgi:hypothetical protein
MKRKIITGVIVVFCGLAQVVYGVPPGFNVQGRLTDANGINRDGSFQIAFAVFSVSTGGTALWKKTFNVTVRNGNFQVLLQGADDQGKNIEDIVKTLNEAYIEITVQNEQPMVPRQPLLRSPLSAQPNVLSGPADVIINSDEKGLGAGNIFLKTTNIDRVTITNAGNIGIGTTNPTAKLEVNGRIKDQNGYIIPVGTIIAYASITPPQGWLYCNGQNLIRTTYAELFAVIGCTFGCPDANTFKVPDLRGEFIRGFDDGRGVDPGRKFGSWQADEFRSHNHSYKYEPVGRDSGKKDSLGPNVWKGFLYTDYTGGSETRPRNVALSYMIKY